MNNFKINDIVYTGLTGDVVKITSIHKLSSSIFSGEVIKHLDGVYPTNHAPVGFKSDSWWAPVFQKYEYKLKNIKIV